VIFWCLRTVVDWFHCDPSQAKVSSSIVKRRLEMQQEHLEPRERGVSAQIIFKNLIPLSKKIHHFLGTHAPRCVQRCSRYLVCEPNESYSTLFSRWTSYWTRYNLYVFLPCSRACWPAWLTSRKRKFCSRVYIVPHGAGSSDKHGWPSRNYLMHSFLYSIKCGCPGNVLVSR
jgi:hypothetical protein